MSISRTKVGGIVPTEKESCSVAMLCMALGIVGMIAACGFIALVFFMSGGV